jgi:peptidoglycan DL-endopeptidase CwlO
VQKTQRPIVIVGTLVFVVTTLLLALAVPASATPVSDKKAQARAVMAQLDELNMKMEIAVEAYNDAVGKLQVVNDKIADNEAALTTARFNLMVAKQSLEARAVAMYKRQSVDLLDVVLASRSFEELITQVDMLNRLGESDVAVVDSIEGYKKDIAKARTELSADRAAAVKLVGDRGATKSEIEAALAKRQTMLHGIENEIAALERQARQQASQAAVDAGVQTVGGTAPPGSPQVVSIAFSKAGCPYEYGAAGPNSFDCSGFTMWCYAQIGKGLPHNAAAQQAMSTPITADQAMAGDLVFFGSPAHHVGIYIGGGMMIHAPHTGAVVGTGSVAGNSGFGRP